MSQEKKQRTVRGLVWAMVAAVMGGVFAASFFAPRVTTSGGATLPVIGGLPEFSLTNQLGTAVSRSDLSGSIWIVNIVFSRCAVLCVEMSRTMQTLQSELKDAPDVRLLTLTTDPEHDTPEVLHRYGKRFSADSEKWTFLTGEKSVIAKLAREGLRLTAEENPEENRVNPDELFIHSELFVVIDGQSQLRGVYSANEPEERAQLLDDLEILRNELKK